MRGTARPAPSLNRLLILKANLPVPINWADLAELDEENYLPRGETRPDLYKVVAVLQSF